MSDTATVYSTIEELYSMIDEAIPEGKEEEQFLIKAKEIVSDLKDKARTLNISCHTCEYVQEEDEVYYCNNAPFFVRKEDRVIKHHDHYCTDGYHRSIQ